MAFRLLKHHLSDFVKVAYGKDHGAENDFSWPFDTLNHRFIDFNKVVFEYVLKEDYEF
jgi:hypothetical protein